MNVASNEKDYDSGCFFAIIHDQLLGLLVSTPDVATISAGQISLAHVANHVNAI